MSEKPTDPQTANGFWKCGDPKGKPLPYVIRSRIIQALGEKVLNEKTGKMQKKYTHEQIADQMKVHPRTVGNLNRSLKQQGLSQVPAVIGGEMTNYTIGVPEPGKQGGFRWSKMTQEQQDTCVRLAIENPRDTSTQLMTKLHALYPELRVSTSTIWRTLNLAGLSYMRAKLKDPLGSGSAATNAKNAEMRSFIEEQRLGARGSLNPFNMFFMDETIVTMNLVASKGWGSKDNAPAFAQSKGKTMTLNLYAGLGIVDPEMIPDTFPNNRDIQNPPKDTYPRGNHLEYSAREKLWSNTDKPPRFALHWWIRPPTRSNTALDPFLNTNDILDRNFVLFLPQKLVSHIDTSPVNRANINELNLGFFRPALYKDDPGAPDQHKQMVDEFLLPLTSDISSDSIKMQELLWLNGVETRQVDQEDASLIKDSEINGYIVQTLENLNTLFANLQTLVANALNIGEPRNVTNSIPRQYYTPTGKQRKGGKIDSERGDRSLFVQYLIHVTNYYRDVFGETVRSRLKMAWDSAPQHGKVDIDSNHVSYIHNWVKEHLGIEEAIFLPVKAPDFNPVEMLFAYLKSQIRLQQRSFTGEMTVQEMIELVDIIMQGVTEDMVRGWVRYSCFRIPGDDTLLDEARCMQYLDKHGDKLVEDAPMEPTSVIQLAVKHWLEQFVVTTKIQNNDIIVNGEFDPDFFAMLRRYDGSDVLLKPIADKLRRFTKSDDLKSKFHIDEAVQVELPESPSSPFHVPHNHFRKDSDAAHIEWLMYDTVKGILTLKDNLHEEALTIETIADNSTTENTANLTMNSATRKWTLSRSNAEVISFKYENKTYKFKAEGRLQFKHNFKHNAYVELFELLRCAFREDANFACIADYVVAKVGPNVPKSEEFKSEVARLVSMLKRRSGVLRSVDKCRASVYNILNLVFPSKFDSAIELNDVLQAYDTLKKGDIVQFTKVGEGPAETIQTLDSKLKILGEKSPSVDKTYKVTRVRSTHIELEDGVHVEARTMYDRTLHYEVMKKDCAKIREVLQKTPYAACLPQLGVEFEPIDMCVLVVKARMHEEDIMKEVNAMLIASVQTNSSDLHFNVSGLRSDVTKALQMMDRKCKECNKSKFKRFPFISVDNIREEHRQMSAMKSKAVKKYNQDENQRRYPGYPAKSADEMKEYKERGTGPNFETRVDDATGLIVPNNKIDSIVDVDRNAVVIKVGDDTKHVRRTDEREWEIYFGKFAQENKLMLELYEQRKKESDKRKEMAKTQTTSANDKILKQIHSPNDTVLTFRNKPTNFKGQICYFDAEKKRVHPPKNMRFQDFVNNTTDDFFLANLELDANDAIEDATTLLRHGNSFVQVSCRKEAMRVTKPSNVHHSVADDDELGANLSGFEFDHVVHVKNNNKYYRVVNQGYSIGFRKEHMMPYNRRLLKLNMRLENVLQQRSEYYSTKVSELKSSFPDVDHDRINTSKVDGDSPEEKRVYFNKQEFKEYMNSLAYEDTNEFKFEELLKIMEDAEVVKAYIDDNA